MAEDPFNHRLLLPLGEVLEDRRSEVAEDECNTWVDDVDQRA